MTKERSESSDVRKWANDLSTASVRSGSSIFHEFDDTELSFQRGSSHLDAGREKEGIDEVFQALLKEANRELAGLLKDVRSKSEGIPFGSDRQVLHTLLMRAVRCAMKQHMLQAELGNLALTDELTGVYNRRGFQVVAERQLKLARRTHRSALLFFVDVDGLKQINDSFGHQEGDVVLLQTVGALEKTFRDSDVIARMGGDEFLILAIEASGRNETRIRERLERYLRAINAKESRYTISLSVGVARLDCGGDNSIRDLVVQADRAMYEQKESHAASGIATRVG
jgi:diguanylate cyclase (GGDEF)-like protein